MDVKGVLFDLDDTLYEYAPCNEKALEAVHLLLEHTHSISFAHFMERHDEVRGQLARELRGQAASHNRALFFKRMVERIAGGTEAGLVSELYACYWEAFRARMRPHPDAHRVLDILREKYALALVSNHTMLPQLEKVRTLGFESYFPVFVTSEEAGVEKPDGRIFALALEKLRLTAAAAVFVGDSLPGDVEGAARMGMRTVHTVEFLQQKSGKSPADYTIHHLAELLDIL